MRGLSQLSPTRLLPHRSRAQATGLGARGRAKPWYRSIDWLNSFWVLLLVVLLVLVARSEAPLALKVLGLCGTLAFATSYVWCVSTMRGWDELPADATAWQALRPVTGKLLLLAALTLPTLPVTGWANLFYLPYFSAIVLFATPMRTGLTLVLGATALSLVSAHLLAPGTSALPAAAGVSASSAFIALGRAQAEISERRRASAAQSVVSKQREEIARDVHDLLGHTLTVLTLKAEVAHRQVEHDPQAAKAELAEIISLSRAALSDVRSTVSRLRTPDLDSQVEATRTALAAAGIDLHLSGSPEAVPDQHHELVAWGLREATTNAVRHSGARNVWVELAPRLLRFTDDGGGITPQVLACPAGNGLAGLRSRTEGAGGQLRVTSPVPSPPAGASANGPGTTLEVVLP